MYRSFGTAVFIAFAVQTFTVGVLAPRLPREVCRPGLEQERSFTFADAPVFRLVNTDGSIRIQPTQRRDIAVHTRILAYTTTSEALAEAEAYLETLFLTEATPEMLSIVTEPGQRPDPLDLRVNYTVELPFGRDVSIDVANGNVWVAAGCSHVSIEGNNSDIEVLQPRNTVSVKTINGRIRVLDSPSETTLETVNGNVLVSLTGGTLQASTITGGIHATLTSENVLACDLTSLNGSITLVMLGECSAEIMASTARGTVYADVGLDPSQAIIKRRLVRGRVGAGAARLSMNSMNGDIVIQRSST